MQRFVNFVKNETVLSIAVILAVLSAAFIPVDGQYFNLGGLHPGRWPIL